MQSLFHSSTGQVAAVAVITLAIVAAVSWHRSRKATAMPAPKEAKAASLPKNYERPGMRFVPPIPPLLVPVREEKKIATKPKVLPVSLVSVKPEPRKPATVPMGLLLPCRTRFAIEARQGGAPILAMVTTDVWYDGRCVAGAGTEVHGRVALAGERAVAQGPLALVEAGGAVRRVDALLLAKGHHEGMAGVAGELVNRARGREAKLFGATFLSAATAALQQWQPAAFGGSVPEHTARNALVAGTGAVLRDYAEDVRRGIEPWFIRIPAGTPFYLYLTQPLNLDSHEE